MTNKKIIASVWCFILLSFSLDLFAQQNSLVNVIAEQINTDTHLVKATNHNTISMYIVISLARRTNVSPSILLPYGISIPPGGEEIELFEINVQDSTLSHSFAISYSVAYGDPDLIEPELDHRYLFPYAHGTKHRVTQGYNGQFTHRGENQYGLDFNLDTGTAIHAAREGLIVAIKEDSRIGGLGSNYEKHANYILVQHSDGTFGNYAHLLYNGVFVNVGDWVDAGQLIGQSGNTGRSSGPHLHFDVRVPTKEGVMQSIRVLFEDHNKNAIAPQEHSYYYAIHPGGDEFPLLFGADLASADFLNYTLPVTINNRIDFRTDQIDLTFIGYVSNGYPEAITVNLQFSLTGVTSDASYPREITIPGGTELFVGLFRVIRNAKHIIIAPRIKIVKQHTDDSE